MKKLNKRNSISDNSIKAYNANSECSCPSVNCDCGWPDPSHVKLGPGRQASDSNVFSADLSSR